MKVRENPRMPEWYTEDGTPGYVSAKGVFVHTGLSEKGYVVHDVATPAEVIEHRGRVVEPNPYAHFSAADIAETFRDEREEVMVVPKDVAAKVTKGVEGSHMFTHLGIDSPPVTETERKFLLELALATKPSKQLVNEYGGLLRSR